MGSTLLPFFKFIFLFPLSSSSPSIFSVCLSLIYIYLPAVYAWEIVTQLCVAVRGQLVGAGCPLPPCGRWRQTQAFGPGRKRPHLLSHFLSRHLVSPRLDPELQTCAPPRPAGSHLYLLFVCAHLIILVIRMTKRPAAQGPRRAGVREALPLTCQLWAVSVLGGGCDFLLTPLGQSRRDSRAGTGGP